MSEKTISEFLDELKDEIKFAPKLFRKVIDLQAQLAKLQWIKITDETLPKDMDEYLWYCDIPGKEILMFGDRELFHEGGYDFTHYKPIRLPKEESDA